TAWRLRVRQLRPGGDPPRTGLAPRRPERHGLRQGREDPLRRELRRPAHLPAHGRRVPAPHLLGAHPAGSAREVPPDPGRARGPRRLRGGHHRARCQPRGDRGALARRRQARHDQVIQRPGAQATGPLSFTSQGSDPMQWFSNLKLAPKLMLAFGLVLVLMLVQGIGAYIGMRSMERVTGELAQDVLPSVTLVGDTRALLGEYRTASYRGLVRA